MDPDLAAIRGASSPEACAAALDALFKSSQDAALRLEASYDAALTYHRLGALSDAQAVLRRLLDDGDDLVPAEADAPTLRQAAQMALAAVLLKQGRPSEAASAFAAAARHFLDRGAALAAMQLAGEALPHLTAGGPASAAPLLSVAAAAAEQVAPGRRLTDALTSVGYGAYRCGDLPSAIALQERALRLARQQGEHEAEGRLLENIVTFASQAGDLSRVAQYGKRAVASARASGSGNLTALLGYTASAYAQLGRGEPTLEILDQLQAQGDLTPAAATAVHGLRAQVLLDLKRHDRAAAVLAELEGAEDPFLSELRDRLASETSGPLTLDCAHRVLGITLGKNASEVSHQNPVPDDPVAPDAYCVPGLDDSDRARFDELWEEMQQPYMQVRWGEPQQRTPVSLTQPMKFEYAEDVADFEQRWRLYRHERDMRRLRRRLRDDWDDLRQRMDTTPGAQVQDKMQYLATVSTLSSIARVLASAGEREAFAPVAFYAADLLEVSTSDPVVAALAWAQRARLVDAARILAGGAVPLLPIELRRSLEQFRALVGQLDSERRQAAIAATVERWVEIAAEEGSGVDPGMVVDAAAPVASLLEPDNRLQVGVALSMAGRHEEALELMESTLAAVRREHPDAATWVSTEMGTAFAIARFLSLCHDAASCRAEYGVFAAPIHAEVAGWTTDVFGFEGSTEGVGAIHVAPLAFADGQLLVLQDSLAGAAYVSAMLHEMEHVMFRAGQLLRTADGQWRRVKRDVPVASAMTYLYALEGPALLGADADAEVPGLEHIRLLALRGEQAVHHEPDRVGAHIANMLAYFDALGGQESATSYPCAAILAGMSRALAGDAGVEGARSYLSHLAVVDHPEALAFGRQRASLGL